MRSTWVGALIVMGVVACAAWALTASALAAPPELTIPFGTPEPVAAVNTDIAENTPFLSADGLTLYFTRGSSGYSWIMVSTRAALNEPFGPPSETHLGNVNTSRRQCVGSLSADGLTLYIHSETHQDGIGASDIWVSTRPDADSDFSAPALLANVNSTSSEIFPQISADGLTLYFGSDRSGRSEFYVANRPLKNLHESGHSSQMRGTQSSS